MIDIDKIEALAQAVITALEVDPEMTQCMALSEFRDATTAEAVLELIAEVRALTEDLELKNVACVDEALRYDLENQVAVLERERDELRNQVTEFKPAWILQQIRAGNFTHVEKSPTRGVPE